MDFKTIYAQHAESYDRLIRAEDYQGVLLPAIEKICPLSGLNVVEMGAGSGRFTRMLAPRVGHILACDGSAHMLGFCKASMQQLDLSNWNTIVADNRRLPVRTSVADLAIAGWSFGHAVGWHTTTWREEIGMAVAEMLRVLRPGGTAIIFETLGSGRKTPLPPNEGLADYYRWLEQGQGFNHTWLRTDYAFASRAEADELTGWFFGAPMETSEGPDGTAIVPECTGVWWRNKRPAGNR